MTRSLSKILPVLCILISNVDLSLAQSLANRQPTSLLGQYSVESQVYTTRDGLPSNEIEEIMQDSRGFVWIATDKGLSRFDGYTFKNFSGFSDNHIRCLAEDSSGILWLQTQNSIELFDPQTFRKTISLNQDMLPPVSWWTIECDAQGNVWTLRENKLYRHVGGTFTEVFDFTLSMFDGEIWRCRLVFGADGDIWIQGVWEIWARLSSSGEFKMLYLPDWKDINPSRSTDNMKMPYWKRFPNILEEIELPYRLVTLTELYKEIGSLRSPWYEEGEVKKPEEALPVATALQ